MFPDTLAGVPLHDAAELHVLQTELTDVDLGESRVLLRVGTLVPDNHLVTTHLHQFCSLHVRQPFQLVLNLQRGLRLGLLEHVQVVDGDETLQVGLPLLRSLLLLVLAHGLLLHLPLLLDLLLVLPLVGGGRGEGRLAGLSGQRFLPSRVLLVLIGHGLPAGPGRAVVEDRTGLAGEMSLPASGEMAAGVTARHRTLPVLYRRILGPRPEDLGGGVVGDLPVLVVLLGLAVRVAAGLGPAAGLARDVNTPLHLAAPRLLPGGRPLQLSTRLGTHRVRQVTRTS